MNKDTSGSTRDCKGKTTAALGLAVRAAGHGLLTYVTE
ncbi:MAG: cob(I)yrinic acid a,c-diamide adenosyltransferase [Gemmatimonadota bacterium]|nr:MAG: cob(I)yrinic acid a,c-diamide adenosyltransferase [Gemmatimonadota bacterium]